MIQRGKRRAVAACAIAMLVMSCKQQVPKNENLTRWVDPFIGTGFHGHVFLGANVPFGAVQLGPVNRTEGWDWCSGYHISDSTIIGFSHTRLSGTGIGELGDVLVMPLTGQVQPYKGQPGVDEKGYYSIFSHSREKAEPGYYSVWLDRYQVQAELTATERVGLHRYQFPEKDSAQLIFDLREGVGWDLATETYVELVSDTVLQGYRYSTGWARDQRIFFHAVLSKPMLSAQLYDSTAIQTGRDHKGRFTKAVLNFGQLSEALQLKVGISPVSMENAAANINAEAPGWNFDQVRKMAGDSWNRELNKIQIESSDSSVLRTFYTALYHTMFAPSLFNDHSGDYRGTDKKVYPKAGFNNYTVFSLWDTYRAANPLYTLIQSERVTDMMASMLAIFEQQGKLPVWHLAGNETNTMPGNSATQVLADAWLKGLINPADSIRVWSALYHTAMGDTRGLNYIKQLGFIPADSMIESAAMALEYAIADDAIAQTALQLGKKGDYAYFLQRSRQYRQYFDSSSGFMRGRVAADKWRTPFSPFEARHMKDDFCEGNSWQYTWLVPQDVEGLIEKMGGENKFAERLDSLFTIEGEMGEHASADITGLIGQYAHGNEPSHHIAYLYTYAGRPWRTAERVRYILNNMYSDKPEGLSGNEDAGQMSAWYILSSLGLYQVQPAGGLFVLGSPLLTQARLNMGGDRYLQIRTVDNSDANIYVQKVTWRGQPLKRSYLLYRELAEGGELVFHMGPRPSETWAVAKEDRPYSILNRH